MALGNQAGPTGLHWVRRCFLHMRIFIIKLARLLPPATCVLCRTSPRVKVET